jgi:hypothetical protein
VNESATPPPVYPLPAPEHDPLFSYGLLFDIADALARHGLLRPTGTDWAHLMTALGGFLYQHKENP